MLLTPDVVANLLADTLFVALGFAAFVVSIQVWRRWDFEKNDALQFALQKRLYLVSTIAQYTLFLKIPSFLFFIYTLDHLASILHGAMCAVGVIGASSYGIYLILLKIVNLYLFAFWIVLNVQDYKHPYLPYAKIKSLFFILIYLLLVGEVVLEYLYFFDIDPQSLLDCCGVVFASTSQTLIAWFLSLPNEMLYGAFYALYLLLLLGYILNNSVLYASLSVLFVPAAIVSLIGYFGTYIYELPTHHCPFCLMQKEYHYIGYFLYIFLFIGSFYGILTGFFAEKKYKRVSIGFITLYTVIVSWYPLAYFAENSKWLY